MYKTEQDFNPRFQPSPLPRFHFSSPPEFRQWLVAPNFTYSQQDREIVDNRMLQIERMGFPQQGKYFKPTLPQPQRFFTPSQIGTQPRWPAQKTTGPVLAQPQFAMQADVPQGGRLLAPRGLDGTQVKRPIRF